MTVPKLEEFTEFLNFSKRYRPTNTCPPEQWNEDMPHSDQVKSLVREFLQAFDKMQKELRLTTAYAKWTAAQPIYSAAVQTAFQLRKKKRHKNFLPEGAFDLESEVTDLTNDILDGFGSGREPGFFGLYITAYLNEIWSRPRWAELNAMALFEYFHTSHASDTIKHRQALSTKSQKAFEALIELRDALEQMQCTDPEVLKALEFDQYHCEVDTSRVERAIRALAIRKPFPKWMDNPLRRNGEHVREQLLVYRYWQMNKRYGRFPASAVRDLMYLEGIEHQYNERTIERMYADFTGLKKQKSLGFPPGLQNGQLTQHLPPAKIDK